METRITEQYFKFGGNKYFRFNSIAVDLGS